MTWTTTPNESGEQSRAAACRSHTDCRLPATTPFPATPRCNFLSRAEISVKHTSRRPWVWARAGDGSSQGLDLDGKNQRHALLHTSHLLKARPGAGGAERPQAEHIELSP